MDDTQNNRPDDFGDISDSGLILLKAKLVLAAIRHETVPAHIRDLAVQRRKMVTPPILRQSRGPKCSSLNSTFRVLGCVAEGIREPLQQGGRDFDGLRAQVGHG